MKEGEIMALDIALIIVGILIVIVGLVSGITSIWLTIKYFRFNRKENSLGVTGMEIARKILDDNGLEHIKVKRTGSILFGNSYSHYFKKVRLRGLIRHETSLTSIGMGAQKAALAILDKEGDEDMKKRVRLVPVITFGPFAFIPLILIGAAIDFFMLGGSGVCTLALGAVGLLFYVYAIVLSVLTLKTEKKAQNRAYDILEREYHITNEELLALKELFHLYNIQYINDIILSSLELLYTLLEIAIAVKGSSDN
jgi:Zn-dependent membrane protease YugP